MNKDRDDLIKKLVASEVIYDAAKAYKGPLRPDWFVAAEAAEAFAAFAKVKNEKENKK